jgi:hypothetical protein
LLSTRSHVFSTSSASADPLQAERLEVGVDPIEFHELLIERGWSDGMPLLPPTEERVRALIDATPYYPDDVVSKMPPKDREATVELVAINGAMAGLAPEAMMHVLAVLEAMSEPKYNMFGLSTTTSGVATAIICNGPSRERLGIDMKAGCMGGAAGRGSTTIGRTVQLCLRNIGGQKVGETSKSVFGQPARAAGLCFAEWEERSPWIPLSQQWGYRADQDVVTIHGSKGTQPLADINCDDPQDLLYLIAKSIAYPLCNKFLTMDGGSGETVVTINPIWADRFATVFPDIEDARVFVHENAWHPIDLWPKANQDLLEQKGRVKPGGKVYMSDGPHQYVLVVCGGLGNLHSICLPSWGDSSLQHQAVGEPRVMNEDRETAAS